MRVRVRVTDAAAREILECCGREQTRGLRDLVAPLCHTHSVRRRHQPGDDRSSPVARAVCGQLSEPVARQCWEARGPLLRHESVVQVRDHRLHLSLAFRSRQPAALGWHLRNEKAASGQMPLDAVLTHQKVGRSGTRPSPSPQPRVPQPTARCPWVASAKRKGGQWSDAAGRCVDASEGGSPTRVNRR